MPVHFSFRRYFWGSVFVGLGVLLLLDNLNVIDFGEFVARFWPVMIIIVGLLITFGKRPNRAYVHGDIDAIEDSENLQLSHTFGDIRLKLNSAAFTGGNLSNVFGNIEVDMENIKLSEGTHNLKFSGVFGDMILILPKNIPVSISAETSFGTIRIKERSSSGVAGRLHFATEGIESVPHKLLIEAHQTFGDIRVF